MTINHEKSSFGDLMSNIPAHREVATIITTLADLLLSVVSRLNSLEDGVMAILDCLKHMPLPSYKHMPDPHLFATLHAMPHFPSSSIPPPSAYQPHLPPPLSTVLSMSPVPYNLHLLNTDQAPSSLPALKPQFHPTSSMSSSICSTEHPSPCLVPLLRHC